MVYDLLNPKTLTSSAQVENMTKKHHVYMTKDGRISMAGLNSARAEYLARAIDDSVSGSWLRGAGS